MDRAQFEAGYRKLVASLGAVSTNARCLACERCEGCSDATFCVDCRGVVRSQYCRECTDCTESSHCSRCKGCMMCTHCESCDRCTSSAYLVKCVGCNGCTYCFGCVGLFKKDFHILNEPYDRQTYFEVAGRLEKELRLG